MTKEIVQTQKGTEQNQLVPQNHYLDQLNRTFHVPERSADKPFISPLVGVADLVRDGCFGDDAVRAALLSTIIINSPRLGVRLAGALICRELSVIRNLVSLCLDIAPKDSYKELDILDQRTLFSHPEHYDGRSIVSVNTQAFKKSAADLISLIDCGYTTAQVESKSKFGSSLQGYKIKPLISVLGAATEPHEICFDHPSLLHIPVSEGSFQGMPDAEDKDLMMRKLILRKSFSRLAPIKVENPFLEQIVDHIKGKFPSITQKKLQSILDVITLCTIINNPTPFSNPEILENMLDVKRGFLDPGKSEKPLKSTKADYYTAWLLLEGLIPAGPQTLSKRQIRVFEALKRINLGKLSQAMINHGNTTVQIATLHSDPETYWADRQKIYEEVNNCSDGKIEWPTLYLELQVLIKEGFVEYTKSGKKHLFAVTTLDAGRFIDLPLPKDIVDSIYKGSKIQVVNPLTNTVDEI